MEAKSEWYALEDETKKDFISQFPSFLEAVAEKGAVDVAKGSYRCRIGSAWDTFSLYEVPDYKTVEYLAEMGDAAGWHRYFEHLFIVGRKIDQLEFERHLLAPRGQLSRHESYVSRERLG